MVRRRLGARLIVNASFTDDVAGADSLSEHPNEDNVYASRFGFVVGALMCTLAGAARVGGQQPVAFSCHFTMIPVRDGVKLHTSICEPRGSHGPLPILITRTPYGIAGDTDVGAGYRFLAADGYVFVTQDIRGRYGSEGQFFMNRPLHDPADAKGTDESTDTYDTVDWLIKNVPNNNGRVGVLGVSYPGFLATMAGINPHPAVKAISPQAPMTDTWMGDDFFHQGAFRLSYGFEYAGDLELSKDQSVPLPINRWDTYDWYLELGPLANVDAKYFHGKVPTWEAFTAASDATTPTGRRAPSSEFSRRRPFRPSPSAAGGTRKIAGVRSRRTRRSSRATRSIGTSSSWARGITADGATRRAPWRSSIPARRTRISATSKPRGSRTGCTTRASWPSRRRTSTTPAPSSGGRSTAGRRKTEARRSSTCTPTARCRSTRPPRSEAQFDEYVSDPGASSSVSSTADRTDLRSARIEVAHVGNAGPALRAGTARRAQRGTSAPLTSDVTIAGDVIAHLVASTTGQDADWVVKLIDVFPDSIPDDWRSADISSWWRTRSCADVTARASRPPSRFSPTRRSPFTVDLHQQSYTFKKGHRIMVQVQSTWFPLYDRNPQTWVANIFQAKATDFKAQTHRVWHTRTERVVRRRHRGEVSPSI